MAKIHVLVYGTLKSDQANFHVMQEAQGVSLGPARTIGADFLLLDLGVFPAAIPVKTDGTVIAGELFEVDSDNLARLDGLEGYPRMYDRIEVDVEYGRPDPDNDWERPVCKAWMYFMRGYRFAGGRKPTVCINGEWFPAIRREDIDLADLVDSDRSGPRCAFGEIVESEDGAEIHRHDEYYDEDDDSYYSLYDGPGIEISVDGPDDLHGAIEGALAAVVDELVDYDDDEDDVEYDELDGLADNSYVTIEGVAANVPVVKAAIEQALQPEQSA